MSPARGYPDPDYSRAVFGWNCPAIAVLMPTNDRTLPFIPRMGGACVRVEWLGYDPSMEKYLEIEV